jgi:pimeloyl-ACP methyl ester carboxylesterase
MQPGWTEEGIEATLANFEVLPDQTVRPWLTLERHMMILKALFEQDPTALFPQIEEPVLICVADNDSNQIQFKRKQVQAAVKELKQVEVLWFPDCAHDIHIDQPSQLAAAIMSFL